jgi:hypothetical protein
MAGGGYCRGRGDHSYPTFEGGSTGGIDTTNINMDAFVVAAAVAKILMKPV